MRLIKNNPAVVLTTAVAFLALCVLGYSITRDFSSKTSYHSDTFSMVISQQDDALKAQLSSGGSGIAFSLPVAQAKMSKVGNTTTFELPDTTLRYEIKKDGTKQGLKETIILKNKEAPNEFSFDLKLENVAKFEPGTQDRSWRFYNNSDKEVFYIPPGFMVDAKGTRSEEVQIAITKDGSNYLLNVTADKSWLADLSRAYPVEIDPTVIIGPEPLNDKNPNYTTWLGGFLTQNPEYKDMPIVKMDEYSVSFGRSDGKIVSQILGGPINYLDENGNWKPIDTTLKKKGDYFTGDGIKTRIKDDGAVEVEGQKFSQKTKGFGYFDPVTQTFTPIANFGQGETDVNKFVRKGEGWRDEITVFDNGLKEELILLKKPKELKDGQLLVLETEVDGINVPDGLIEGELTWGDLHFPKPYAYDAKKDEPEAKRYAQKIDGKQVIYTGVPVSWLASAVYPVVIDPDYAGTTADGSVRGQSNTYATARSTSNLIFASTGFLGQWLSGPTYNLFDVFLKFDTAAIPDTDTVSQVNLKLVAVADNSSVDFDVQIVKQDWSAQDPITDANREAAYDNCLAGTQDGGSPWRNTAGMSINTQYASPNLDTAWVVKTGPTYYSLISSRMHDGSGTAPTGTEYITIALTDDATASYRPVLTVVHAPVDAVKIGGSVQFQGAIEF